MRLTGNIFNSTAVLFKKSIIFELELTMSNIYIDLNGADLEQRSRHCMEPLKPVVCALAQ